MKLIQTIASSLLTVQLLPLISASTNDPSHRDLHQNCEVSASVQCYLGQQHDHAHDIDNRPHSNHENVECGQLSKNDPCGEFNLTFVMKYCNEMNEADVAIREKRIVVKLGDEVFGMNDMMPEKESFSSSSYSSVGPLSVSVPNMNGTLEKGKCQILKRSKTINSCMNKKSIPASIKFEGWVKDYQNIDGHYCYAFSYLKILLPRSKSSPPSYYPTKSPSYPSPSIAPSSPREPTLVPTVINTTSTDQQEPTDESIHPPSSIPTAANTLIPSGIPSKEKTSSPTYEPTIMLTLSETDNPVGTPSQQPTLTPSSTTATTAIGDPTLSPTVVTSMNTTVPTTTAPTIADTNKPSSVPSEALTSSSPTKLLTMQSSMSSKPSMAAVTEDKITNIPSINSSTTTTTMNTSDKSNRPTQQSISTFIEPEPEEPTSEPSLSELLPNEDDDDRGGIVDFFPVR